jgi:hypothetical protein
MPFRSILLLIEGYALVEIFETHVRLFYGHALMRDNYD